MREPALILLLSGCLLVNAQAQGKPSPAFEDFATHGKFVGKPAAPKILSRLARRFRTMIRDQAQNGPNFAGHYTVAYWGCGAGCMQLAIIDAKNGNVFFPQSLRTVMILLEQDPEEDKPLQYRVDSNLLIVTGYKEGANGSASGRGKFYYLWNGNELKLLRREKFVATGSALVRFINSPIGVF